MREVVFALEFRGHAAAGSDGKRRAKTVAPSQALTTVLAAGGIHAEVEPVEGERAILESIVERFPDGSFVEDGTIAYGSAGAVTFVTVGRGAVRPAPIAGWTSGVVMWTVTGGAGVFRDATGFITSNFTVSAGGEVVDNHVARLYVP